MASNLDENPPVKLVNKKETKADYIYCGLSIIILPDTLDLRSVQQYYKHLIRFLSVLNRWEKRVDLQLRYKNC
jgi:hypothetical protein